MNIPTKISTKISIVIPTYRRPDLLEAALRSCVAQQEFALGDVEIVVVDNCPDASACARIDQFLSRHDDLEDGRNFQYIHEAKPGVGHARNSGVRAAKGEYILFLDDDETAQSQWLCEFLRYASQGEKAVFGPVLPIYQTAPTRLKQAVHDMFSRALEAKDGADITASYPYLGTGNAMFHKQDCFGQETPFSTDVTLGEDTMLLLSLTRQNKKFIWAARAAVNEYVPEARMSFGYIARRKFESGQVRSRLFARSKGQGRAPLFFWMAAGAAQTGIFGILCGLIWLINKDKAQLYALKALGGLGKVFWMDRFSRFNP